MACVKKRRGKWVIDYRDTEGKRHWITVDGNRQDAEQELSKIIGAGKRPVNRKITVRQQAQNWLENEAKQRLKNSTYLEYKAALENHIFPFLGSKRFCKVERDDLIAFITKKDKKEGLSRATIKNLVAPLRAMYYDAALATGSTYNPVFKLGKIYPEKDSTKIEPKPLNKEEIRHMLKVAGEKQKHWYPMLLCAARTGMRLGELIALRWEQIDFHGRFIVVNHNFSRGEFTTTKNKKSRDVEMSLQLTGVLKRLLASKKAKALKDGAGELPELVFLDQEGKRVDSTSFTKRVFHRILEMAGLRRVKFHSLRHSFGSLLIEQGEDLNYVKDQLGHHSITITVDTYGHRLSNDRSAVDALDDPIESGSKKVDMVAEKLDRRADHAA